MAGNGTVVYNPTVGAALSVLTWYDRAGKELGRVGDLGILANPALSPDGSRVAVDIADAKADSVNIWISDLKNGTRSRFTFDPGEDDDAVWSHDAARIAFRSTQTSYSQIFLKQAQGILLPKSIFDMRSLETDAQKSGDVVPTLVRSLDDKEILCTLQPTTGGSRLTLVTISTGKMTPFLTTTASETNGQISPDGKWVAYGSDSPATRRFTSPLFPARPASGRSPAAEALNLAGAAIVRRFSISGLSPRSPRCR